MLPTQGNTQVYSPFGSYVVEQHDTACDAAPLPEEPSAPLPQAGREEGRFEVIPNLPPYWAGTVLSSDQAMIALFLQRYYQPGNAGPTPERLRALLHELERETQAGGREAA